MGLISSNPIQLVDPQPVSPGSALEGEEFNLVVNVDLDAPVAGALQVEILDQDDTPINTPICLDVNNPGLDSYSFDYSFSESGSGLKEYQIWARYRDNGSCLIEDTSGYDISQGYQIDWEEDSPVLELENSAEETILSGGNDDLGELNPFQPITQQYYIFNPSNTNSFQITGIIFNDLVNEIGRASCRERV